jgi:hypothetical protein
MFADPRPRPGDGDDADDEGPGRLCPACAARRAAVEHGLAAAAVVGVAALAFASAYPFM